jgi:hypothetical protein
MIKITITFIFFLVFISGYSQHGVLLFRKKNKTLNTYLKGSYIAFQLESHQWIAGIINRVQKDSVYLKPLEIVYGVLHNDTLATEVVGFALTEVYAMPKPGVQVDYDHGIFEISKSGGHVHWYWIKSGWIFRVLGAGYAGLVITNGIIQNDLSLAGSKLGIAAVVFLFGEILHLSYTPTLRLGKKYHLETV